MEIKENKRNHKIKYWLIGVFSFIVLIICVMFGVSLYMWNQMFDNHYYTYEATSYKVDEFDGLECQNVEFASNDGQMLQGYLYTCDDVTPSGLVVMAHGFGGGGHNSYMPIAAYFAKAGFTVFAYDATACDASEGDGIKGLPQGVIDLDYAISYAESLPQLKGEPVYLFGHSWGAYCTCSVLQYHPEVKAVCAMSGFNTETDLIKAQAIENAGVFGNVLTPFAKVIEKVKLGKYSNLSAMDGFAATDASVMIVHGKEDETVPLSYGYEIYKEKYGADPRFTFVLRENRDHDHIYYSDEAIAYCAEFNKNAKLAQEKETKMSDEEAGEWKDEYIKENLDRDVWDNVIDEELFDLIAEFYRNCE